MAHRIALPFTPRRVAILAGLTGALLATPLLAVATQTIPTPIASTSATSEINLDGWNKTDEGLEYWQSGKKLTSRWLLDQGV